MGATDHTPHLELPQFVDGDKPTWLGDFNGAMSTIDTSFFSKADKSTIDFYFADYGVVADGTDQTANVQACINAAAVSGGTVHPLRGETVSIAGEVFIKGGVVFTGDTGNYNGVSGATNTPVFRFINDAARIRYGAYAGNAGSVDGDQPGAFTNTLIDGNGHGALSNVTSGAVYVECTGFNMNNVEVINYLGAGIYFQAAQNGEVIGCDVRTSGVGIILDNGSGGIKFDRCEISNNQRGLALLDDPAKPNAYPFGPAHIQFTHCIFENYAAYVCAVDITCGSVYFDNCDFSNDGVAALNSRGTLIEISNPVFTTIPSYAIFNSCIFAGGTDAGSTLIQLDGLNEFYLYGETYIQASAKPFVQNGGVGVGQIEGSFIKGNRVGATMMNVINGGSLVDWFVTKTMTVEYIIDPTVTLAAIYVKELGDTGVRGYYASNGQIVWCSGADFNEIGAIGLNTDGITTLYLNHNGHVFTGPITAASAVAIVGAVTMAAGLTVSGGATAVAALTATGLFSRGAGLVESYQASVPAGAIVADVSSTSHLLFSMTGAATVTTLTINNAVNGSKLRITYSINTGTFTIKWPTGAVSAIGKAALPATQVGPGQISAEFQYLAGTWYELSRNF